MGVIVSEENVMQLDWTQLETTRAIRVLAGTVSRSVQKKKGCSGGVMTATVGL